MESQYNFSTISDILEYEFYSAKGFWLGTSIGWTLENHLNIGLISNYSQAYTKDGPGGKKDIGDKYTGVTLGYHW